MDQILETRWSECSCFANSDQQSILWDKGTEKNVTCWARLDRYGGCGKVSVFFSRKSCTSFEEQAGMFLSSSLIPLMVVSGLDFLHFVKSNVPLLPLFLSSTHGIFSYRVSIRKIFHQEVHHCRGWGRGLACFLQVGKLLRFGGAGGILKGRGLGGFSYGLYSQCLWAHLWYSVVWRCATLEQFSLLTHISRYPPIASQLLAEQVNLQRVICQQRSH